MARRARRTPQQPPFVESVGAAARFRKQHGMGMENSEADSVEEYVRAQGAQLERMEGRVLVRHAGSVEIGTLSVPYRLVPAAGILANAGKWRNLSQDKRLALVRERVHPEALAALREEVRSFAADIAALADEHGLDPMVYLQTLETTETATPADQVFARIRQRLEHAIERRMEERQAERTRASINLAEYPDSFELARRMRRRFIAVLGPTNSGKTHQAMADLGSAGSGVYLAPLRLLALENYERLQAMEFDGRRLKVNLVTGEERRIEEGATHVASTVEMLDPSTPVDVAVIDEVQMLADRDRGAAWTAAVCGVPAATVYLVGAPEARRAIEALAKRLDCPLEIRVLQRKAPLSLEAQAVRKLRNLRRGDAVIAFSRREVLMWRDMITELGMSVSTVYGNLSPEVRQAQAARFREGTAEIVVGTDAIAMGLNLPIERVVLTTVTKYNGVEEEELSPAATRQIAGRAGRYGVHEEGFVAGYDEDTHHVLRALLKEKPAPVPAQGFSVAPTLAHLNRIAAVTGETALARLLQRFIHDIDVPDGFFTPRVTEEQTDRALWLDTLKLPLEQKFTLSLTPISSRLPALHGVWQQWSRQVAADRPVRLERESEDMAWMRQSLQEVEDTCKLYAAYAWLSFRLPRHFPDGETAQRLARELSERIDRMLQAQNAAMRRKPGRRRY
jgi:ATP-dependent RNA helicase SUPV3L1/SUV3